MTSFSFVHITDHHIGESETALQGGVVSADTFRAVMHSIAQNVALSADFIVSTGDLVEPPSSAAYETVRALLHLNGDKSRVPGPLYVSIEGLRRYPMYFLPGNHDDRRAFIRYLFPDSTPTRLVNATFTHKNVQFICLDWGPEPKAVADPVMLSYLRYTLHTHIPSILLMHHQPVPIGSQWLDRFVADDVARFWDIVRGGNVLGIFCGHAHTTHEAIVGGIPVFGLRSTIYQFARQDEPLLWMAPPHYRMVTVKDEKISTQVFEVPTM